MALAQKTKKGFTYADYLTWPNKDKREKKALYEKYGVKEYILIDPSALVVEHFKHIL